MKKILLICIIALILPFSAFSGQKTVSYNHQAIKSVIYKLKKQHFHIKKVERKLNQLIKHSTIISDSKATCEDTKYYSLFVEEWKKFIESLQGEEKEKFMKFAQENGLDNFDSSL